MQSPITVLFYLFVHTCPRTHQFPSLSRRVYGEENNAFENKLGESITVQVVPEVESTRQMLLTILDGNVSTVESLVEVIYEQEYKPVYTSLGTTPLAPKGLTVEQNDIAIWIDPIGEGVGNASSALL